MTAPARPTAARGGFPYNQTRTMAEVAAQRRDFGRAMRITQEARCPRGTAMLVMAGQGLTQDQPRKD